MQKLKGIFEMGVKFYWVRAVVLWFTHDIPLLVEKTLFNDMDGILEYSYDLAFDEYETKSVSYTHLDVYKRQVLKPFIKII